MPIAQHASTCPAHVLKPWDVGRGPRAALVAGEIAEEARFFSLGTNDLTQTTLGVSRDRDGARGPVPGRLTRLPLELLEESRRVGGEPSEAVARFELADEAGCVPGGSAGELALFEDEDVGDVASSEVVRDRAADDATADDDHLGATGQGHRETPLVAVTARATEAVGHIAANTSRRTRATEESVWAGRQAR